MTVVLSGLYIFWPYQTNFARSKGTISSVKRIRQMPLNTSFNNKIAVKNSLKSIENRFQIFVTMPVSPNNRISHTILSLLYKTALPF